MIGLIIIVWAAACGGFLTGLVFGRAVARWNTADRFDEGYQAALHALAWVNGYQR